MILFGSSGALLEAFWGRRGPFWTFWLPYGPIRVAKFHLPRDVAPVWGLLDPIWVSAGGKVPPFRLLAIQEGPSSGGVRGSGVGISGHISLTGGGPV